MVVEEVIRFPCGAGLNITTEEISHTLTKAASDMDTQVIFKFQLHHTLLVTPPSSLDPSGTVQRVSGLQAKDEIPMKFSELITESGIQKQVSALHGFVLKYVRRGMYWNIFQQRATSIIGKAVEEARSLKPEATTILFDIEHLDPVIWGGLSPGYATSTEPVERVVQESMRRHRVVKVPASASSVAALETRKFDKEGTSDESCRICLDKFLMGVNVTSMPCSHVFHQRCILSWLRKMNTCPLCRFALPT